MEIVRSGELGKIAFVRTWNYGNDKQEGYGNPPDGNAPAGLDWDMRLGLAPRRPFNANRFGVDPEDKYFSSFRWFWDYAGGMMTDWGVHLLDIVQMASNEEMPTTITPVGGKYWLTDDHETPDTLQVSYEYPSGFFTVYENRNSNGNSRFDHDYGILFHGQKGTLFIDRGVSRHSRGEIGRESARSEGDLQRQRESLGEFPRMRSHAPEADFRYRSLPALHHNLPARQRGAAQPDSPHLGRKGLEMSSRGSAEVSDERVS